MTSQKAIENSPLKMATRACLGGFMVLKEDGSGFLVYESGRKGTATYRFKKLKTEPKELLGFTDWQSLMHSV